MGQLQRGPSREGDSRQAAGVIAYQRVLDAFRGEGLNVKELATGKAQAQAPGHSNADFSVSITDIGDQVLVHSHSDPTEMVLESVGLVYGDLFDSPQGTTYEYPDGRQVHRSPTKQFRQSGNTKGTQLYHGDRLTTADTVYVGEGEKDVHALEALGVAATCTAMGAGKAHLFDLTPLHGKNVIVVRDLDGAGEGHAKQLVELLTGVAESVSVVQPKAGKDAADHIAHGHGVDDFVPDGMTRQVQVMAALKAALVNAETLSADDAIQHVYRSLDKLSADNQVEGLHEWDELVDDWWDWINAPAVDHQVVATPWPELDDLLAGGLHAGRSYLIAGRPGGGKSLGLTNIAAYAAEKGSRGILYSVEMGRREITSRILAAGAQAEYGQMTRRKVDQPNLERLAMYSDDVRGMQLLVCDKPNVTVDKIRQQARTIKASKGLDFVAVDYVQLLTPTDSRASRERQIAEISWGLKMMAKELDIAVITACQLNRAASKEQRPPTIAELRESGSLEQDADVVILLHHNQVEGTSTGEIELILGKNRTGPLSTVTLPWRPHYARIG